MVTRRKDKAEAPENPMCKKKENSRSEMISAERKKRRIRLTVAYDGTNYCGWQVQPNGITVQEVLNRALSDLLGEEIRTIGASRTDAGVHALGNVAVFDTDSRIPGEKFSYALNAGLPEDIVIQKSEEVSPSFHPRFTRTVKTYEYRILNRHFPDPTRRLNSLFCYGKLDFPKMKAAAACFEGTHDFRSFAASGGNTAETKSSVRTVYRSELFREADLICYRITGNGFLYHMVRIIAGTLLEVGRGSMEPERIPEIIEARDRSKAGPTAVARGLTLVEIRYPDWGD